ncbi:hypothetical protein PG911_16245 [Tenacibaculum ovolyticum]|uniref:hypothetical protein n=1 Tax=Tenacibaculum ovolyticum TaxID=104270 RepID=UPI0022F3FC04|nr:hypothetical protein [Tenacibaculum ovolyticum]WBX76163.1 hypothetical protein PG911_16245 [Tenacibaculum ovolyticum]
MFIVINVFNYLFSLLTDTFGIGTVPFLFVNITFYIILINLFYDYLNKYSFDRSFWLILRGYIWFSLIGLFSVISMFFLVKVMDFNPLVNDVGSKMDLFAPNLKNPDTNYYFPYNISIFLESKDIRIPFFQKEGIITGIFHEPHTATFLLSPALFILLYFLKSRFKKIFFIFLFTLFFLIQASTTNIIGLLLVICVFNFNKYKKNVILLVLLITGSIIGFFVINPEIYSFIVLRFSSGSASYSLTTLKFPFTPKTLIGSSFYDLSYINTYWNTADKTQNVGYIMFFLNLSFLIIFVINQVKSLIELKKRRLLAIIPLYFLFHSTKIAMYSYSLSYLIFIIFIIYILSNFKEDYVSKID